MVAKTKNKGFTPASKISLARGLSENYNSLVRGFTLIELLVVMAIIAILAGVILVSMTSARDKARANAALQTAKSVMPAAMECALKAKNIMTNYPASSTGDGLAIICDGSDITWPTLNTSSTSGWVWLGSSGSSGLNTYYYYLTNAPAPFNPRPAGSIDVWCTVNSTTVWPGVQPGTCVLHYN